MKPFPPNLKTKPLVFTTALLLLGNAATFAQQPSRPQPGDAPAEQPSNPSLLTEPGRWLQPMEEHGVKFQVGYIGEVFGNLSGGDKQGAIYEGLLKVGVELDLEKLCGWKGGDVFVNVLYPHGSSLTDRYVHDFNVVSNMDAYDSLRLNEAWFEQHFANDQFSVRIGQLAADSEFFVCDSGAYFINGAFGALPLISQNVSAPVYPLASPAVRVQWTPTKSFLTRAGVFAGDAGDPGRNDQHGTRFRLGSDDGALILAEAAYKTNAEENAKGLPGTFKLGGFYHTAKFADNRGGDEHRGDYGAYAVADQTVYREPCCCDGKNPCESEQGLNVFARIGGAPVDRNIVSAYLEGGLNYKGLLPGRDDDICGLACSYTRISDDFQSGESQPTHHETILEFTYQAILTPWLSIQPDVQYIFNPGAVTKQDDALVAGVRMNFTF